MSPLELLDALETNGYRLKVRDGRLVGPRGLSKELADAVRENKEELITLITHQCPRCNQPIRTVMDTPNVKWLVCSSDPLDFALMIPRQSGKPSFITCGGFKPVNCVQCGKSNDGEWKYCSECWLALFEEDERTQAASVGD